MDGPFRLAFRDSASRTFGQPTPAKLSGATRLGIRAGQGHVRGCRMGHVRLSGPVERLLYPAGESGRQAKAGYPRRRPVSAGADLARHADDLRRARPEGGFAAYPAAGIPHGCAAIVPPDPGAGGAARKAGAERGLEAGAKKDRRPGELVADLPVPVWPAHTHPIVDETIGCADIKVSMQRIGQ